MWGWSSGRSSRERGENGRRQKSRPGRDRKKNKVREKPQSEIPKASKNKKKTGSGWFSRRSEPALEEPGTAHPGHLDWARETVLQTMVDLQASPLERIRTKVPWRSSSGKSVVLHPLGRDAFMQEYFAQKAVILRRGVHHRQLLSVAEATGLLRNAKLGVDADMMGPHLWNTGSHPRVPRPAYSPEYGLPAVAALARGKAVRLQHIERRAPRIFRRDPFLKQLSRLSPGRGLAAKLHWSPPRVRSVWEHEDHFDQLILQLYGSRKWTVCTRTLPPPTQNTVEARRRGGNTTLGNCTSANLRYGDMLYLPSWTWHWTGEGPKASSHLELGILPLNGADLVMGLGARHRIASMVHKAMAMPLPIWRSARADSDNVTELSIRHCLDLPWADAPMITGAICNFPSIQRALQRLSGSSGRQLNSWDPQAPLRQARDFADRPAWPRSRREGHFFTPLIEAIAPVAQILGIILLAFVAMCVCGALAPESKPNRGRSTAQIRNDRRLLRRSNERRSAMQKKKD